MSTRSSKFCLALLSFPIRLMLALFLIRITITRRTRSLLWITSSVVGVASMFSVTLYYIPSYRYSQLESALYNSLHRLGWSFFSGWMVLGCVTSEGSALKRFLSSRALVPLSRLTYCAYLTNGFIELYLAASVRTPKFMSITNLVSSSMAIRDLQNFIFFLLVHIQLGETLSHVSLTFLAALILCLMFESPIHGLEKILLRRSSEARPRASESDDLHNSLNSRTPSTSEASSVWEKSQALS